MGVKTRRARITLIGAIVVAGSGCAEDAKMGNWVVVPQQGTVTETAPIYRFIPPPEYPGLMNRIGIRAVFVNDFGRYLCASVRPSSDGQALDVQLPVGYPRTPKKGALQIREFGKEPFMIEIPELPSAASEVLPSPNNGLRLESELREGRGSTVQASVLVEVPDELKGSSGRIEIRRTNAGSVRRNPFAGAGAWVKGQRELARVPLPYADVLDVAEVRFYPDAPTSRSDEFLVDRFVLGRQDGRLSLRLPEQVVVSRDDGKRVVFPAQSQVAGVGGFEIKASAASSDDALIRLVLLEPSPLELGVRRVKVGRSEVVESGPGEASPDFGRQRMRFRLDTVIDPDHPLTMIGRIRHPAKPPG